MQIPGWEPPIRTKIPFPPAPPPRPLMVFMSAAIPPKDMLFYNTLKPWLDEERSSFAHSPWLSLLGDGLLLSAGDKWSKHHRMLTPTFHFNILKPYMKIFTKSAEIMHHLIKKGHTHLDMFEHTSLMTLDSLQKGVFSFDSNCQEGPSEYIATFLELSALVAKLHWQIFLHMDFPGFLTPDGQHFLRTCPYAVTQEQCQPLLRDSIDDFLKVKVKTKTLDFIDVLLLTKMKMGKDCQMKISELKLTPSCLRCPERQEHCWQEVQEFLKDREPKETERDDLAQLPFLTMCIKDSL
ncbi:hypothetical protein Celaphus_00003045 [Cervus elaphus hippelaphus]|uniref:Uncharacterized protein n=1 Tax=Cervus elaphus hippelaphus TaxID=46360 RepID=A0A212D227_CEREH|nr:hypothetical protein Celaphus_00003045 [Cervus elaphus hippelaphus]